MKMGFLLVLAVLLAPRAFADSNGVERGQINISGNTQIPRGVEDRIEDTIFANCDLRNAGAITATFTDVTEDEQNLVTDYHLQYAVFFPAEGRTDMISVHARLFLHARPGHAVEIAAFSSPICRSFP